VVEHKPSKVQTLVLPKQRGRKDRRKEGQKEGMEEGRNGGKKEGRKEKCVTLESCILFWKI
jgi:flagellar biosynthesis/type III secretory pathway protein FliH